ncbi:unnamed protein product, partial [Strongylus vulgaris]
SASVHHLLPTVDKFGLKVCYGRRFNHVKIENPSGFPDLQETMPDCRIAFKVSFTPSEWKALSVFDEEVSAETRPILELLELEDSETAAVFDSKVIILFLL